MTIAMISVLILFFVLFLVGQIWLLELPTFLTVKQRLEERCTSILIPSVTGTIRLDRSASMGHTTPCLEWQSATSETSIRTDMEVWATLFIYLQSLRANHTSQSHNWLLLCYKVRTTLRWMNVFDGFWTVEQQRTVRVKCRFLFFLQILLWELRSMKMEKFSSTEAPMLELRLNLLR